MSRALGLSKGTVSRALNGYPDISARTRQRVERMARTLGYVPLSQAQGLRTGRSKALALVLQSFDHDEQRAFLTDFILGLSETAAAQGWTLTVSTAASEADTLAQMRQLISERKADGFILPRCKLEDTRIPLLRELGVPFVVFGRSPKDTRCSWFDYRGAAAMQDAVARLHALGHRRIAYLGGGAAYGYEAERARGFQLAMAEHGLQLPQEAGAEYVQTNILTRKDGARATADLLRLSEPPTALVFALESAALGAWSAAKETGHNGPRIGRDLAVMAYGIGPEAAFQTPPLAGYGADMRHAARRLTALLIADLSTASDRRNPQNIEEDTEFRPAASLCPAPAAQKVQKGQ